MSSSDAERNRAFWDARADEYQETHREHIGRPEPRWGIWQLPESELQVLGDVAGKDVLELGCGAAQWSILLAAQGARCVGFDNSERQLEHARAAGADFPLVHGSAESLPFPDGSFDLVFCDHGAMTFADPYSSRARGLACAPERRSLRLQHHELARVGLLGRRGGRGRACASGRLFRPAPPRGFRRLGRLPAPGGRVDPSSSAARGSWSWT